MNVRRVATLVVKEWREIVRDRVFFLLAFIMPVAWMVVFGYGMNMDVVNLPVAILDQDRSSMSRDYADHFINSRYFSFKGYLADPHEADRLLRAGKLRVVIVIPPRFHEELASGRTVAVQAILDGTFAYRVRGIAGYVDAITRDANQAIQTRQLADRFGIPPARAQVIVQPIRLEVRYLYNQALRSVWSIAPTLIMFTMMIAPAVLTSLAVVREKETGSIYNIYASTVTRAEYLIGKLLPNVMISTVNVVVLWLIALLHFGAPFKGDPLFFFIASITYVTCTCCIGFLVSMLVHTQSAALLITMILAVVPAVQFSGMFTPVAFLPPSSALLAHLFPPMYYNNIVQGAFMKGVGWQVLWADVLILATYAAALLLASYLAFRKRVSS